MGLVTSCPSSSGVYFGVKPFPGREEGCSTALQKSGVRCGKISTFFTEAYLVSYFHAGLVIFYKDQQVSLIASLVSVAEGTGNILY